MNTPASTLLVTEPPVWFITGCSTGFGLELGKQAIGNVRLAVRAASGKQPGDPVRAAQAIIAAVAKGNPPHHPLLGKNAFDGAMAKLDELRKVFKAAETVARAADFPKTKVAEVA